MKPFTADRPMAACLRPLSLLALAVLALSACGGEPNAGSGRSAPPPPQVVVAEVQPRDVPVTQAYAGRVRGSREVEVRARVQGVLLERLYDEGARVARGEPLFRIDAEPFEIALRAARAEQDNAAAELEQAQREWGRLSGLYERNAVSRRERDQAETQLKLAKARLAMAEAAVADARRNLSYTEVQAPVSGTTGLETVPEGSLLQQGALLTTVTQHDPAHVRFALPENDAAVQRLARRAMSAGAGEHSYPARVRLADGQWYERAGTVDFTASSVDPRTGTVSARAVFDNPDGALVPGQFVRVRLVLQTLEDVFVIAPEAVGESAEGPRVFVMAQDDTVEARTVRLGPQVGDGQVILAGLQAGDRLVVNGQVALSDGATVRPRTAADEGER
ncbi:efflux RND transporter periplasmic adaptor subunit [Alkalilimnicola sp. S0819]|uniref:efflux RND transporter periplasmic adaptor subunit n=1 Tax=Alkalilimnicola sp. S0819 TaxID=2613922 RepID=UPI001262925F|nr:efflux RND transporter periplasmic adaptor subunit [Alkalilimnicola sp. S0819]KAB7627935.1 efflux RND transporter periplasmic adaptor subunit [Alkalilimnicola sp. S0819]MPQ15573.1 efflux RND transporter periplasmic adaptor subunit [Alkalilimnicola sp. S0819]